MKTRKTLKELTLKDNFMFGAVMCDEDNCRMLLEMILQFPIDRVEVSKEKSIIYHPEYKGVRLDVYAKDEKNTHYNVEMQALQKPALGKRARYYHSQIDMELLLSGEDYTELPDTFVIFICDFDPCGEQRYCYTFGQQCLESPTVNLQDGSKTFFLSTCGNNPESVPVSMVKFMDYVKADLTESTKDFEDEFVKKLQNSVRQVKESRKMEENYMIWHEMLRDERAEGKAEAIIDLLEELGDVSDSLRATIMSQTDMPTLKNWLKSAAKAESIEQFRQNM